MKKTVIYLFAVCLIFCFSVGISIAAEESSSSGKSVTKSVTGKAKEVQQGTVKFFKENKDAIVRDAKALKEEVPKDLKEAKKDALQKAGDVKQGASSEWKEARDNMANPTLNTKPE